MINRLNDYELCEYRKWLRSAYNALDKLTADGEEDLLFHAYHRISHAADRAMDRLNKIKREVL